MVDIKLTDMIDFATLQEIREGFAKLVGLEIDADDDISAADFLHSIADVLTKATADGDISVSGSTAAKLVEAENIVSGTVKRINTLAKTFENVNKIAEDTAAEVASTKGTVKVIQDIALNTKILGFNASIEASRAKESGKGFGVIAQEVRNLAETSKVSADKIEKTMQHIGDFSQGMNEEVMSTKEVVDKCISDLNGFAELLSEIRASAE